MAVQARRAVISVLVLLVLFASQAAYAVQAQGRSNGHCAGEAPPAESCPLPLWLTCCDDHAAVGTALNGPGTGSPLALRLESASAFAFTATKPQAAMRADLAPDTPLRRSVILLI